MESEGTYVSVTLRDPKFDKVLRRLVVLFIGDLDAYILWKNLFTQEENEWNFISLFHIPSPGKGILLSRFEQMRALI